MTATRAAAAAAREQAEMLELCAAQQEKVAAAKAAYADDPTPENRAALREAMREVAEFRSWVRAVGRIRRWQRQLAGLGEGEGEKRAALEAGISEMYRLAGLPEGSVPPEPDLPDPESVRLFSRPVRGRGRVTRATRRG